MFDFCQRSNVWILLDGRLEPGVAASKNAGHSPGNSLKLNNREPVSGMTLSADPAFTLVMATVVRATAAVLGPENASTRASRPERPLQQQSALPLIDVAVQPAVKVGVSVHVCKLKAAATKLSGMDGKASARAQLQTPDRNAAHGLKAVHLFIHLVPSTEHCAKVVHGASRGPSRLCN